MDTHIENAFLVVATNVRMLQHGLGCTTGQLATSLKQLERTLVNASEGARMYILDVYASEAARVKFTIKELRDPTIISLHDRIFTNLLKMRRRVPQGVTALFEAFIKGITYFAWQQDPVDPIPVYHRLTSCGPGTETFRADNHICRRGQLKDVNARRRALVERCYLERLIFDELYKHETIHDEQDAGHQHRLGITKEDFETCCKGWEIQASIEYSDSMPIKLTVERFYRGKMSTRETYEKTFSFAVAGNKVYDPTVLCTREAGNKVLQKIQTFKSLGDWRRPSPKAQQ